MNTTHPGADWFSRITGFAEGPYETTRSRLRVEDGRLVSSLGTERWGVGTLELPSLASLRSRCATAGAGRSTVQAIAGDVRALHRDPRFAGALFQVASQFNLLEMVGPDVTPEQGVTRYMHDRTQGPACAMAAGAGTIYRNYLMPLGVGIGQTRDRQVDTAAALQQQLAAEMQLAPQALWTMRNGYLLPSRESLERIGRHLVTATEAGRDALRSQLCIGWHRRVEVTDGDALRPTVSQAYCSAVPVSYSGLHKALWQPLARLVLEAAYEATLLAACIQRSDEGNAKVLLTRLGGGAFGNDDDWSDAAIRRALRLTEGMGLEVWLVCYGTVDDRTRALVAEAA
jgi:hypothetical protein